MDNSKLYMGCDGKVHPTREGIEEFCSDIKQPLIVEEKYDGMWGALIWDANGDVEILSRNGKPKNLIGVSEFAESLKFQDTILVGELGFGSQAETELAKKRGHHRFVAFDLIKYGGIDLTNHKTIHRKDQVKQLFAKMDVNPFIEEGSWKLTASAKKIADTFERVVDRGGEGLILKEPETRYKLGKRHPEWYKVKKMVSKEFQILGYEMSDSDKYGQLGWIKNILLGELSGPNSLEDKVVCRCGSMDEETRKKLSENQAKYLRKIVEIGGYEIFKSGAVRHPFFVKFREDL